MSLTVSLQAIVLVVLSVYMVNRTRNEHTYNYYVYAFPDRRNIMLNTYTNITTTAMYP